MLKISLKAARVNANMTLLEGAKAIGIGKDKRAAAYDRIREVVARHPSARLADFSDHEYEPYYLFDIVHFGWTGWIDAEKALYEFATEGN